MAATATLTANPVDTTAGASIYTFSGVNIGTAEAGRIIAVFAVQRINSNTIRSLTSITIGGNTATAGPTTTNSGGTNSQRSASATLQVDSGTAADIVVTWSGTCTYCAIEVYAIYGADSATAFDTIADNTVGAPTGTIDVPANGVLVAAAHSRDVSTTGASFAWTGPTEDLDTISIVDALVQSAASAAYGTTQTGLTVTATYTGGGTWQHLLAMSFSPAVTASVHSLTLLGVGT